QLRNPANRGPGRGREVAGGKSRVEPDLTPPHGAGEEDEGMASLTALVVASYLLLDCEPEPVLLERVRGRNGAGLAIRQLGACYNKSGKWEYEPMPSSRTEAFFKRCRWGSPDAALKFWVKSGGASAG